MILNSDNILSLTGGGLDIYRYVLSSYYLRKDSLFDIDRALPNPFVAGGQLLIEFDGQRYTHRDLKFPAFKGTALDFAGHYLKTATKNELYYLLNQNLKLGLQIPSMELLEQLEKNGESAWPKMSYFEPPISNTTPSGSLSLPQLYRKIIGPEYQKVTEQLRLLNDPKEARQYKASHFPYVTLGGVFEKRSDKHLLTPSGLLVIDLDDLQEVAPIRETLIAEKDYETELLFVSPSGRGLKWVTSYPQQQISHRDYFRLLCSYLEAVFNLSPDQSGKDISRACFICRDETAFLHRKYLF